MTCAVFDCCVVVVDVISMAMCCGCDCYEVGGCCCVFYAECFQIVDSVVAEAMSFCSAVIIDTLKVK